MNLEKFFNPKSIAVIGASDDPTKVGYALISNLKNGDKKRKLYPITVSAKTACGLRAYPSVLQIPGTVDLAVIAVRADIVPQILDECGKKKTPAAIVISSGFKEAGEKGAALEQQVRELAKKHGILLLGPNCLGVVNSKTDLNATFAPSKPLPGRVTFISQSGATGTALLDRATREGVGFASFVSLGNEAALTEIDFLEYAHTDRNTSAILLYLEKVSDGKKFLELLRKITKKKPVVILKAGRSRRGQQAAMSHTGSLAGTDDVFFSACRQNGAILVDSVRSLFNFAKLFHMGVTKPPTWLAILTNGGGPSIVAADLIELSKSLNLTEFDLKTKYALSKVLPPMAAVNNPVDIIGDALSDRYAATLDILSKLKHVDAIIAILTPQMMTEPEKTARVLLRYSKIKPIIPVFMGGTAVEPGIAALRAGGLANFDFPKDAVETLDLLARGSMKNADAIPPPAAPHQKVMGFTETSLLLSKFGIPLSGTLVQDKEEFGIAWGKLRGAPAALKAISPDFTHKTEAGAVKLNLMDIGTAEAALAAMLDSLKAKYPHAAVEGILVQPMTQGREVIIGMKRDPIFGPAIVFGLGGIFTETLKDTTMRIAPIDKKTAIAMMREIKGCPLLAGARGQRPVDLNALAKLIVALSKLSLKHPEIKELDLNPVIVNERGAVVVDARIV